MDFKELKQIIKEEGGKIVIVENDRPEFVVMSFEEWRKGKVDAPPRSKPVAESQREEPRPAESSSQPPEPNSRELTIDDLPL